MSLESPALQVNSLLLSHLGTKVMYTDPMEETHRKGYGRIPNARPPLSPGRTFPVYMSFVSGDFYWGFIA